MDKNQMFLLLILNSCVLIGYYIWHLNGVSQSLSGARQQVVMATRNEHQCQHTNRTGRGLVRRWITSTNELSQRPKEACTTPRTTFVFIKVHKAGGTTELAILDRVAVTRNLTAAIPRMSVVLGHPFQLRLEDYHCLNEGRFDVLAEHSVYNRDVMDSILKPGALYLAILRKPVSQLASTFHYYGIEKRYRKGPVSNNPVENFLSDPWKREPKPYRDGRNPPYSKYRNWQASEMGFPLGLSDNKAAIDDWVKSTGREFYFVIILEHFDESMVMLRRLMCWDMKDIIYLRPSLAKSYKYKTKPPSEQTVRNHRKFSTADYTLYEYWNASLWRRIAKEGRDFYKEVAVYKQINSDAAIYCPTALKASVPPKVFPQTKWHPRFQIDQLFCKLLDMTTMEYRRLLFALMYAHGKLKYFENVKEKLHLSSVTWEDIMTHNYERIVKRTKRKARKQTV